MTIPGLAASDGSGRRGLASGLLIALLTIRSGGSVGTRSSATKNEQRKPASASRCRRSPPITTAPCTKPRAFRCRLPVLSLPSDARNPLAAHLDADCTSTPTTWAIPSRPPPHPRCRSPPAPCCRCWPSCRPLPPCGYPSHSSPSSSRSAWPVPSAHASAAAISAAPSYGWSSAERWGWPSPTVSGTCSAPPSANVSAPAATQLDVGLRPQRCDGAIQALVSPAQPRAPGPL